MSAISQKARLNPQVFYPASALILLILVITAIFPQQADEGFKALQNAIVSNGSWFYVLTVALVLLSVAFLGLSRYGEIKLGPDHSTPDYSNITWFAMLFSAGMGIGLMFFGVAEPVMHFLSPPVSSPESLDAAREAMKITFFHWGLHAWGIYAIVALILAFFSYRHGLPLTMRSALYPLIGGKIHGPIGHTVDIFAVLGTVFGVATSLGFGVSQVNSGLNYLFDVPQTTAVQIGLIFFVTLLAILSVTTGLDKGIRRLSELNMGMAVFLLLFVLICGSTVFLLKAFVQNLGAYASEIVHYTFNLFAYEKKDWIGGWTIFYWGWWISWAPFVGLFIARVSRGRTIREFAVGVLFVPTGFTLMWMTFFGNSAIDLILNQGSSLGETVSNNVPLALFTFLEQFPFSSLLSVIATVMVIVFFVTSSDSGSMVVDMLCSNGHDNTPIWQRVYWAACEGVVAAILLVAGGLGALQTMAIAAALPFSIVLLIATYGLLKALRVDAYKRESLQINVAPIAPAANPASWQDRLQNIVDYPSKVVVHKFIQNKATNACNSIAKELAKLNLNTEVIHNKKNDSVSLQVMLGDEMDFIYEVRCRSHIKPAFAQENMDENEVTEDQRYYRAEVHLREGGQDYDVMGWSTEAIINDIVDQYHKHMYFLHLVR